MIKALGIDTSQVFGGNDRHADVPLQRLTQEAELQKLAQRIDDAGLALLLEVAAALQGCIRPLSSRQGHMTRKAEAAPWSPRRVIAAR